MVMTYLSSLPWGLYVSYNTGKEHRAREREIERREKRGKIQLFFFLSPRDSLFFSSFLSLCFNSLSDQTATFSLSYTCFSIIMFSSNACSFMVHYNTSQSTFHTLTHNPVKLTNCIIYFWQKVGIAAT